MRLSFTRCKEEGWRTMKATYKDAPSFVPKLYWCFLSSMWGPILICIRCSLRQSFSSQLFLETRQCIKPIRTQSFFPRLSTQRKPSQFKVVEVQAARPHWTSIKCTKCSTISHTRASRICLSQHSHILQLAGVVMVAVRAVCCFI